MDYNAVMLVAAAALIYILISAVSLKICTWILGKLMAPAGTQAPGFFRCCGLVLLLNATAAAIAYGTYAAFDFLMRQPGARSSDAMTVGGIVYYPLIFITTTLILKKLLPTSYVLAILINMLQIFVSFCILVFYITLAIMIAYDFGRKH